MNNLIIQPKKCFLANTNDHDVIIPPLLGCCYRFRLSFSSNFFSSQQTFTWKFRRDGNDLVFRFQEVPHLPFQYLFQNHNYHRTLSQTGQNRMHIIPSHRSCCLLSFILCLMKPFMLVIILE